MIIDPSDNCYKKGESLNLIPYRNLTCEEMAEVYAYLLAKYGRNDVRVNGPISELTKRSKRLTALEDEVTYLKSELEHLRDDSVS